MSHSYKAHLSKFFRLPFDYHYFPAYQFVFAFCCYSLFIAIMTLVGIDGTFYGSCLYIAAQFQIVEQKIINLVNDTKSVASHEENRKIKVKLIDIVRHHNQCMELTEKLSQIYEFIVFNDFTSASIVMGLCSVNIIMTKGMDKLVFVSYLVAAGIEVFGFCKNGSTLTDSSARIATAIYNFEWYKYDRDVKYAVLTMLMRSQKTTELQIPFHSVSMETFADVSQKTFTLIFFLPK
jgi:7tm Odorant receptor